MTTQWSPRLAALRQAYLAAWRAWNAAADARAEADDIYEASGECAPRPGTAPTMHTEPYPTMEHDALNSAFNACTEAQNALLQAIRQEAGL